MHEYCLYDFAILLIKDAWTISQKSLDFTNENVAVWVKQSSNTTRLLAIYFSFKADFPLIIISNAQTVYPWSFYKKFSFQLDLSDGPRLKLIIHNFTSWDYWFSFDEESTESQLIIGKYELCRTVEQVINEWAQIIVLFISGFHFAVITLIVLPFTIEGQTIFMPQHFTVSMSLVKSPLSFISRSLRVKNVLHLPGVSTAFPILKRSNKCFSGSELQFASTFKTTFNEFTVRFKTLVDSMATFLGFNLELRFIARCEY